MARGLIVPARVVAPLAVVELERFEDYQRIVGGWVEAVDIDPIGSTLFVNEEGLMRGLPSNSRATFLWWYHAPQARGSAMLVGDAVLVGLPDAEGNSTNLPEFVEHRFLGPSSYRVDIKTRADGPWIEATEPIEDYFDALAWAFVHIQHDPVTFDARVECVESGSPNEIDRG